MRLILRTLDMRVIYSCACMCIAIAIDCACVGRDLYVRAAEGFSLNDTSWAISARIRVWKFPVMLITIGMISTCSRILLCCKLACVFERVVDSIDVVYNIRHVPFCRVF
jgi:hypothetical protein